VNLEIVCVEGIVREETYFASLDMTMNVLCYLLLLGGDRLGDRGDLNFTQTHKSKIDYLGLLSLGDELGPLGGVLQKVRREMRSDFIVCETKHTI
jgi:hypothetical protein